jgi:hypothetical protein
MRRIRTVYIVVALPLAIIRSGAISSSYRLASRMGYTVRLFVTARGHGRLYIGHVASIIRCALSCGVQWVTELGQVGGGTPTTITGEVIVVSSTQITCALYG